MFSCNLCFNHDICQEVCPALEEALKEQGIYSANYIRKHNETPFSPQDIDSISAKSATKLKTGRKINGNTEYD